MLISYLSLQTVFAKGGGPYLDVQKELGYETVGLDWTVDPEEARKVVGNDITLQGNLDPQDLYKTPVSIEQCTYLLLTPVVHPLCILVKRVGRQECITTAMSNSGLITKNQLLRNLIHKFRQQGL